MSEELIEELKHALELGNAGGHECYIPLATHSKAARERIECQLEHVLPIIRRRELEAGEKVKEAAVDAVSEGEVWSDVPFSTAIRALDVAAIIGDSDA